MTTDLEKMFIGFDPNDLFFNNRTNSSFTASLATHTKPKKTQTTTSYPPYNVISRGDDQFIVELAVAGFDREELSVTQDDRQLTVSGNKFDAPDDYEGVNDTYVHKGISTKKFTRHFKLVEYLEIEEVKLENGILSILMKLDIPEEKKPVEFKIK